MAQPKPADEVINATAEYDIGIYEVSEPNCAWNEYLETAVNAATQKTFGCGFICAASTPSAKARYLPGGTMQLICGKVAGRRHYNGEDKLGW